MILTYLLEISKINVGVFRLSSLTQNCTRCISKQVLSGADASSEKKTTKSHNLSYLYLPCYICNKCGSSVVQILKPWSVSGSGVECLPRSPVLKKHSNIVFVRFFRSATRPNVAPLYATKHKCPKKSQESETVNIKDKVVRERGLSLGKIGSEMRKIAFQIKQEQCSKKICEPKVKSDIKKVPQKTALSILPSPKLTGNYINNRKVVESQSLKELKERIQKRKPKELPLGMKQNAFVGSNLQTSEVLMSPSFSESKFKHKSTDPYLENKELSLPSPYFFVQEAVNNKELANGTLSDPSLVNANTRSKPKIETKIKTLVADESVTPYVPSPRLLTSSNDDRSFDANVLTRQINSAFKFSFPKKNVQDILGSIPTKDETQSQAYCDLKIANYPSPSFKFSNFPHDKVRRSSSSMRPDKMLSTSAVNPTSIKLSNYKSELSTGFDDYLMNSDNEVRRKSKSKALGKGKNDHIKDNNRQQIVSSRPPLSKDPVLELQVAKQPKKLSSDPSKTNLSPSINKKNDLKVTIQDHTPFLDKPLNGFTPVLKKDMHSKSSNNEVRQQKDDEEESEHPEYSNNKTATRGGDQHIKTFRNQEASFADGSNSQKRVLHLFSKRVIEVTGPEDEFDSLNRRTISSTFENNEMHKTNFQNSSSPVMTHLGEGIDKEIISSTRTLPIGKQKVVTSDKNIASSAIYNNSEDLSTTRSGHNPRECVHGQSATYPSQNREYPVHDDISQGSDFSQQTKQNDNLKINENQDGFLDSKDVSHPNVRGQENLEVFSSHQSSHTSNDGNYMKGEYERIFMPQIQIGKSKIVEHTRKIMEPTNKEKKDEHFDNNSSSLAQAPLFPSQNSTDDKSFKHLEYDTDSIPSSHITEEQVQMPINMRKHLKENVNGYRDVSIESELKQRINNDVFEITLAEESKRSFDILKKLVKEELRAKGSSNSNKSVNVSQINKGENIVSAVPKYVRYKNESKESVSNISREPKSDSKDVHKSEISSYNERNLKHSYYHLGKAKSFMKRFFDNVGLDHHNFNGSSGAQSSGTFGHPEYNGSQLPSKSQYSQSFNRENSANSQSSTKIRSRNLDANHNLNDENINIPNRKKKLSLDKRKLWDFSATKQTIPKLQPKSSNWYDDFKNRNDSSVDPASRFSNLPYNAGAQSSHNFQGVPEPSKTYKTPPVTPQEVTENVISEVHTPHTIEDYSLSVNPSSFSSFPPQDTATSTSPAEDANSTYNEYYSKPSSTGAIDSIPPNLLNDTVSYVFEDPKLSNIQNNSKFNNLNAVNTTINNTPQYGKTNARRNSHSIVSPSPDLSTLIDNIPNNYNGRNYWSEVKTPAYSKNEDFSVENSLLRNNVNPDKSRTYPSSGLNTNGNSVNFVASRNPNLNIDANGYYFYKPEEFNTAKTNNSNQYPYGFNATHGTTNTETDGNYFIDLGSRNFVASTDLSNQYPNRLEEHHKTFYAHSDKGYSHNHLSNAAVMNKESNRHYPYGFNTAHGTVNTETEENYMLDRGTRNFVASTNVNKQYPNGLEKHDRTFYANSDKSYSQDHRSNVAFVNEESNRRYPFGFNTAHSIANTDTEGNYIFDRGTRNFVASTNVSKQYPNGLEKHDKTFYANSDKSYSHDHRHNVASVNEESNRHYPHKYSHEFEVPHYSMKSDSNLQYHQNNSLSNGAINRLNDARVVKSTNHGLSKLQKTDKEKTSVNNLSPSIKEYDEESSDSVRSNSFQNRATKAAKKGNYVVAAGVDKTSTKRNSNSRLEKSLNSIESEKKSPDNISANHTYSKSVADSFQKTGVVDPPPPEFFYRYFSENLNNDSNYSILNLPKNLSGYFQKFVGWKNVKDGSKSDDSNSRDAVNAAQSRNSKDDLTLLPEIKPAIETPFEKLTKPLTPIIDKINRNVDSYYVKNVLVDNPMKSISKVAFARRVNANASSEDTGCSACNKISQLSSSIQNGVPFLKGKKLTYNFRKGYLSGNEHEYPTKLIKKGSFKKKAVFKKGNQGFFKGVHSKKFEPSEVELKMINKKPFIPIKPKLSSYTHFINEMEQQNVNSTNSSKKVLKRLPLKSSTKLKALTEKTRITVKKTDANGFKHLIAVDRPKGVTTMPSLTKQTKEEVGSKPSMTSSREISDLKVVTSSNTKVNNDSRGNVKNTSNLPGPNGVSFIPDVENKDNSIVSKTGESQVLNAVKNSVQSVSKSISDVITSSTKAVTSKMSQESHSEPEVSRNNETYSRVKTPLEEDTCSTVEPPGKKKSNSRSWLNILKTYSYSSKKKKGNPYKAFSDLYSN